MGVVLTAVSATALLAFSTAMAGRPLFDDELLERPT